MGLAAAAEQATAESAQSELDQVREVVGGKLLLALDLIFVVLLGRCCKQEILPGVNLLSVSARGLIEILDHGLVLDEFLVSTHEEANDS